MAEEVLVSPRLLNSMIDGGARLFQMLTEDGYLPASAFWIEEDATPGWKLVIAFSGVSSSNPFPFYKKVFDRAPSTPGLYWPALIKIEDAHHPLIQAVHQAISQEYPKDHKGFATVNLHSTQFAPVTLYVYRA